MRKTKKPLRKISYYSFTDFECYALFENDQLIHYSSYSDHDISFYVLGQVLQHLGSKLVQLKKLSPKHKAALRESNSDFDGEEDFN